MPNTPDTRLLRENVIDRLKDQKLDPEDLAEKVAEVRHRTYVELVTEFPECRSDFA